MNPRWFIFIFALTIHYGYSQTFQLITKVPIKSPTDVSTDTNGNIYYASFDGDIIRYDHLLKNKEIFSPENPSKIDLLEAWQGLRIFTFHRELQLYRLINRNLSLSENYNFPADKIGFVLMATPTFDNNIWLIDQEDFSLKRYQIYSNSIPVISPLNLQLDPKNYEIRWMREYQNRLFIGVPEVGILLFDNMGNYVKTYEESQLNALGFFGDEVYFIKNEELARINIYTDAKKLWPLPKDDQWKFIILSASDLYLFSDSSLALYGFTSE